MNLTQCEAQALAKAIIEPLGLLKNVEVAVCPAYPFITDVARALMGTKIELGVQDIAWEEKGAFTGEVSPRMVDSLVKFVILGHSERRTKLQETDGVINWKLVNALKYQLTPILCVGESEPVREAGPAGRDRNGAGDMQIFIKKQLSDDLHGIESVALEDFVIAYEPIWAIGTGKNATAAQANDGCAYVREVVEELYGNKIAAKVRVLYGGSVNAGNAAQLAAGSDVDGFLVGNASLQVQEFAAICQAMEGR